MVSSHESSDKLQQGVSPPSDVTFSQGIHDTKADLSKSEGATEGATGIPSAVAKNEVKDSDATACALQSDLDKSTYSLPIEKKLQNPDSPSGVLPSLQAALDSPSIIREKVQKDGYNWRKYGQKHVKGNEFIRSYYKCTHPNCQAKKQLQQSNNGHVTESLCIGQHNHHRPQLNTTPPVESVLHVVEQEPPKLPLANVEDKASAEDGCMPQQIKPALSPPTPKVSPAVELQAAYLPLIKAKDDVHNNFDRESKRLKKDSIDADVTGAAISTCESRVVVQTSSEVDLVNDGYRWRKYGQKLVKGNTNPRSYYRCSNPGCPVKKHVERAPQDSKIVITTYEGQHDHDIPPGRTVTHNVSTGTPTMATNDKLGTKSGVNNVYVDKRENSSLDLESRSNEKLNGESITQSKAGDMVEFRVITHCNEDPKSKLSEQEQHNDNSGNREDSVSNDNVRHSSSKVPCTLNEQMISELRTTSEGNKDHPDVVAGHDTPSTESEFTKQSTSDAKPVES